MSEQDNEAKPAMFYFLAGGLVDTTSQDDLDSLRNGEWRIVGIWASVDRMILQTFPSNRSGPESPEEVSLDR